jgi:puromycin-sensitive aminopeptidase
VRPLEGTVHVEVDPALSGRFRGEVTHRLEIGARHRTIELHAADLAVSAAWIETGGRRLRGRVTLHPERQTAVVRFDGTVPPGEARLRLAFSGKLRGDLRGLYAARAGERRYAFTQLEAADARRFFPCFDEPAMKARFTLSVTTGHGNTVLSNTPVAKVEPLGGGRKTVHFRPTPPLSTYLLALAVGELEASSAVHCGRTEIRVWHVPGKGALTPFALECARETLARLESWFDLPYPYEKLDLVAVPDFEAGAMENAGAVFFRETALLADEATVTLQERKRVAEVICHELAHMWYGDLVTMAWWNDLWLNEAFATWMAFQIVDSWRPEWRMWHDFQHHRASALATDALEHTHPIYTEVRSPEEATQNFDVITYEKGASVVRMVERFLGPKAFRAGVRSYIRRHRESNAEAADLWRALEEASGQAVEPVVRAWIEQPGFPLLRVQRHEEEGRAGLLFRQERFHARAGAGQGGAARWPIPWVGRLGSATGRGTTLARHLVTRARERMDLDGAPPRFVYGNADEGGFFRPLHDEAELVRIASELGALTGVERMGLVSHQWAAVRAGHARLGGFLELAAAFGREADPDVLLTLRAPLGWLEDRLAPDLGEDAVRALRGRIEAIFGPAFAAAGWDAYADESDEAKLRRAALLSLVGEVAQSEAVLGEAASRCRRYLDDRGCLDPNLADGVVNLAARGGDAALFERLLAAAGEARTPQERRRMLMALAEFRDPALFERTLQLSLGDAVGTQDVALVLVRLLGNPAARERTWAFMKRRWSALLRRMPPMLVTRPVEALPALGGRTARNDVAAFFKAHPVPTAARALRQALERFDLDLELRRRAAPDLGRWLGAGR